MHTANIYIYTLHAAYINIYRIQYILIYTVIIFNHSIISIHLFRLYGLISLSSKRPCHNSNVSQVCQVALGKFTSESLGFGVSTAACWLEFESFAGEQSRSFQLYIFTSGVSPEVSRVLALESWISLEGYFIYLGWQMSRGEVLNFQGVLSESLCLRHL